MTELNHALYEDAPSPNKLRRLLTIGGLAVASAAATLAIATHGGDRAPVEPGTLQVPGTSENGINEFSVDVEPLSKSELRAGKSVVGEWNLRVLDWINSGADPETLSDIDWTDDSYGDLKAIAKAGDSANIDTLVADGWKKDHSLKKRIRKIKRIHHDTLLNNYLAMDTQKPEDAIPKLELAPIVPGSAVVRERTPDKMVVSYEHNWLYADWSMDVDTDKFDFYSADTAGQYTVTFIAKDGAWVVADIESDD